MEKSIYYAFEYAYEHEYNKNMNDHIRDQRISQCYASNAMRKFSSSSLYLFAVSYCNAEEVNVFQK